MARHTIFHVKKSREELDDFAKSVENECSFPKIWFGVPSYVQHQYFKMIKLVQIETVVLIWSSSHDILFTWLVNRVYINWCNSKTYFKVDQSYYFWFAIVYNFKVTFIIFMSKGCPVYTAKRTISFHLS